MSDANEEIQENWAGMIDEMNNAVAQSVEQNMEAQAAFMESWMGAFEDSVPDEEAMSDGFEGYENAYEVWMEAAEQMSSRITDAAQGRDVDITEFRDIWLQSANKALSEVMGTTAFAAGTGEMVGNLMDLQQEVDETSQDTLESLGFATRDDVDEVAERLIELERRQHGVEAEFDRLEAIENTLSDINGKLDRIDDLEEEVEGIQEDVENIREDVETIEDVQDNVDGIQDDVEDVQEDVGAAQDDLEDVETRVGQLTEEEG
jgi:DNA repair exonuclease SbcCD ATPase subunit